MIKRHCPTCSTTFALIAYADRADAMAKVVTRKHLWDTEVALHMRMCAVVALMDIVTLPKESVDKLVETYFSNLKEPDEYLR